MDSGPTRGAAPPRGGRGSKGWRGTRWEASGEESPPEERWDVGAKMALRCRRAGGQALALQGQVQEDVAGTGRCGVCACTWACGGPWPSSALAQSACLPLSSVTPASSGAVGGRSHQDVPRDPEPSSAPLPPSNQHSLNMTLGACFSFLRIPRAPWRRAALRGWGGWGGGSTSQQLRF